MKKLFLDLDGVIIDFVGGVIDWYDLKFQSADIKSWDAIFEYSNMPRSRFWEGLTTDFWLGLKKYPHADHILKMVEPYKPCILTSPSITSAGARQQWIKENMPDYFNDGRYFIGPAKSFLAHENAILIDDSSDHIDNWNAKNGTGLLFPASWNDSGHIEPISWLQKELNIIMIN